jgi:hypothetical protein
LNRYSCPADDVLTPLVLGQLSPADQLEVAEHLGLCERCCSAHAEKLRSQRRHSVRYWQAAGLSNRASNALAKSKVDSWAHLGKLSLRDLRAKPGIGEKTVVEIRNLAAKQGLTLSSECPVFAPRMIFRLSRPSSAERDLLLDLESLAAEFPSLAFEDRPRRTARPGICLTSEEWTSPDFDFYRLDARIDALAEQGAGAFEILLEPGEGAARMARTARTAREILTRCQRWSGRRNEASRGALFERALAGHRKLHDLARPLVRADYNHALDTWQWVLRLAPEAGLALQLAALLHDAERLISEADVRVEHRAADYRAFKQEHAAGGAELAETVLARAGIGAAERRQAALLIAAHEEPPTPGDPAAPEISLLNDADALSFFSLNSVGYLDYFGPEPTRRKVAYTLRRLRPPARRHLAGIRLPPAVAAALAEESRAA